MRPPSGLYMPVPLWWVIASECEVFFFNLSTSLKLLLTSCLVIATRKWLVQSLASLATKNTNLKYNDILFGIK